MSANKHHFTKEYLNSLQPAQPKKRYVVYDSTQTCLSVRVSDNNVKSFVVLKKHNNKVVRITLGHYPEMSIQEARKQTINILSKFHAGENPNQTKHEYRIQKTLGDLFAEFMERYSKLEKKSWRQDEQEIPKFLGHWFNRKIGDICKPEIQALFDKISANNGKYQANHTLERLRAMYNKAIEWDWIAQNPTNNIKKHRTTKRDRYMTKEEFIKFKKVLSQEPQIYQAFFLLLLYTGARKSNVLAMRWCDIDLEQKIWHIPDTKNGEPVTIPLIDQAIQILNKLPHISEWVFPNPENPSRHYVYFTKAWKRILKQSNLDNLRIHDLRRTMASWQAIQGTSLLTIGKSLGHKSMQSTEIYARLSTKAVRDAMQKAIDSNQ